MTRKKTGGRIVVERVFRKRVEGVVVEPIKECNTFLEAHQVAEEERKQEENRGKGVVVTYYPPREAQEL